MNWSDEDFMVASYLTATERTAIHHPVVRRGAIMPKRMASFYTGFSLVRRNAISMQRDNRLATCIDKSKNCVNKCL